MLFNSQVFLLGFLPICLAGYFLLGLFRRPMLSMAWLTFASIFFYGWWRVDFVPLMLGSITFNYFVAIGIMRWKSKQLLIAGIAGNLLVLGLFKYSGFLAEVINDATNLGIPVPHLILPLAISFHTFQQIAYLVDSYTEDSYEPSYAKYLLFVLFFPQLIAGPIVHHKEMLPQFDRPEAYRLDVSKFVLGVTAFSLGLFKKVFIADAIASQTPMAFGQAADGIAANFVDSWLGAISFALQLYFDFSGYSDMAIGLGLMFGIKLPVNFNSPFKAASIIEFWSRWHMTLTRFLTSYLYNPIVISITRRRMQAGKPLFNRNAPQFGPFIILLAIPTLITMTLAGIWHGAGWNFLIFGLLHGAYLVVNHGWRATRRVFGWSRSFGFLGHWVGVTTTCIAVVVSLVFFKASSLAEALTVVRGMIGLGADLPYLTPRAGLDPNHLSFLGLLKWRLVTSQGAMILGTIAIAWFLPNTPEYIERISGTVRARTDQVRGLLAWPLWGRVWSGTWELLAARPTYVQGTAIGILLALALLRIVSVAPSEFLYYTF